MMLTRFFQDDVCTLGHLVSNDAQFSCFTIERPATGDHPCVPAGTYDVTYELHHPGTPGAYRVPVLDTSAIGRDHIQMHVANFASELRGCIGVGEHADDHCVEDSQAAFDRMMAYLPNHPWTLQIVEAFG